MHCAPRTQIPRISCYEITDTCERVFQRFGIRSNGSGYPLEKIVIHLNGTGYPFEIGISSLRATIHSRKIVIRSRSNGSGCPVEKNCHPFEQLELSVQNNCHPRYCSKPFSPELLIATNVSKNVSLHK